MRAILVIGGILSSAFLLFFVSVPFGRYGVTGPDLIKGILYWPALVAAGLTIIASCIALVVTKRMFYIVTLCLAIPFPLYTFSRAYSEEQYRNTLRWSDQASLIARYMLYYYRVHPERFLWTGQEEEVEIQGFADFFNATPDPMRWNEIKRKIKVKDGTIRGPGGETLYFGLDKDGDAEVVFRDRTKNLTGRADPFRDSGFGEQYRIGVAVVSSSQDKSTFSGGYSDWQDRLNK